MKPKEHRCKYRTELASYTDDIKRLIAWFDDEMQNKSSYERGERIAKAINSLAMFNDQKRHRLGIL